jgi:hypothetical protein
MMKNLSNIFMIFLIAVGLVIVPVISMTPINSVNAQSQSATSQQTSQPPSQNNSKAQVGQVFTFNEKSKPANDPEKCAALASEVKGKAIPDYNLCDVVVYRQAPAIVRHDGLVLNNFSGIGHYIEMVPASVLNNTAMYAGNSSNSNDNATNLKAGFGEFALIDSEVIPVREIMQKYNWTETALHHHMLGETPKILFLHWSVTGDANDLINQAKEMMMQTATYQNLSENSKTPTSAGP